MSQTPERRDPTAPPPMPRWVKVSATIFIVLVLAVIALHLSGFDFGAHMHHIR